MTSSRPHDASDWAEDNSPPTSLGLHADFPPPSFEEWRAVVDKDLGGAPFDKKLVWKTYEGLDVQPLYTRKDLDGRDHLDSLPGFEPFTRGAYPLSGVSPSWQVRQDCMLAAAESCNAAIRDGLARGQTAIGIRLDNAARLGIDGDSPRARELSGRGGCAISSINGIRIALADIDLARYPITFRTGTAALPVFAMLVAYAEEQRLDPGQLFGSVECDPIRSLAKNGRWRTTREGVYREMTEMAKWCAAKSPGFRPVMVNSHVFHNGGASAAQELGAAMSVGAEYLREMAAAGLSADDAAKAMVFSFSVGASPFIEIAKFRAARTLWARIARLFGAQDEHAPRMFLHARTSTFTKSRNDPHNNLVRNSIEAMAAAIGGCDSLYIAPFDETLGRPDEFSMRMARNQHLLLKEEAQLTRVVDAAAGSYFVESLTDGVAREAWAFLQAIEQQGGATGALMSGWLQKQLGATLSKREKAAASRRASLVGVSNYPDLDEKPLKRQHIARDAFLAERKRRLARLKAIRANAEVRQLLEVVGNIAYAGGEGLVDASIAAARAGATIGELITALNHAGEPPAEVAPVRTTRLAKPFERLRERGAAWRDLYGDFPTVLLVQTGPAAMRRARAEFCQGFFGAGGFRALAAGPVEGAAAVAEAILASNARVAVLCSDDATYPLIAAEAIAAVRAKRPEQVVLVAGYPADAVDALREAGVDDFVHIRADALELLSKLQDKLGIGA